MLRKLSPNSVLCECTLVLLLFVCCVSCVNTRSATYFPDATDGIITSNTPIPESIIQKNDILNIVISSRSAEASAPFNPSNQTAPDLTFMNNGLGGNNGYLVSSEGTIQLPFLGSFKIVGLTKTQLIDAITKAILDKKLLVDPVVSIRFLNFRVTVLGEVNRPAVVSVPNEKISLLEAIGLAGDITIYGKRDNVLVIREEDGKKTLKRLDLNSNDLFSSNYYYLKSNDIVYVEPNKARVAAAGRSNQWLPILFSGLSLVAIVADRALSN